MLSSPASESRESSPYRRQRLRGFRERLRNALFRERHGEEHKDTRRRSIYATEHGAVHSMRRWIWGSILVCAVGTGAVGSLLLTRRFAVTTIEVTDARPEIAHAVQLSATDIIHSRARFFGTTNLFLVPRSVLEEELPRQFPVLHTVQVIRRLPGTVHIVLQEKVPVALFFADGVYYALDPDGIAFEEVSPERLRDTTYPVIRNEHSTVPVKPGNHVLPASVLTLLQDVVGMLPERFGLAVRELTVPAIGAEELRIQTSEGWLLLLDASRPLETQFAAMEKVFSEEINPERRLQLLYLDLRVPGKAFYMTKP